MIYETYVTSLRSGLLEYGFTFKEAEGVDDSLFDLVLGTVKPEPGTPAKLDEAWAANEWAAKAIVASEP